MKPKKFYQIVHLSQEQGSNFALNLKPRQDKTSFVGEKPRQAKTNDFELAQIKTKSLRASNCSGNSRTRILYVQKINRETRKSQTKLSLNKLNNHWAM